MSSQRTAVPQDWPADKKTASFFFDSRERGPPQSRPLADGVQDSQRADCGLPQRMNIRPLVSHKFMRLLNSLPEQPFASRTAPRLPAISSSKSLKASLRAEEQTSQQRRSAHPRDCSGEFSFAADEREPERLASSTAEPDAAQAHRKAGAVEPKVQQQHRSAIHSSLEFAPFAVASRAAYSHSFLVSSSLLAAKNARPSPVSSESAGMHDIISAYQQRALLKRKPLDSNGQSKQSAARVGNTPVTQTTVPLRFDALAQQQRPWMDLSLLAEADRTTGPVLDRLPAAALESKNAQIHRLTLKYLARILDIAETRRTADSRQSCGVLPSHAGLSSFEDCRRPAEQRATDVCLQPVQRRRRTRVKAFSSVDRP